MLSVCVIESVSDHLRYKVGIAAFLYVTTFLQSAKLMAEYVSQTICNCVRDAFLCVKEVVSDHLRLAIFNYSPMTIYLEMLVTFVFLVIA
jgi:hypothetical protein